MTYQAAPANEKQPAGKDEVGGLPRTPVNLAFLSWPIIWSIFLTMGWLLPNHYLPWIAFHTDAWIAWMFALAGCAVIVSFRDQIAWTWLALASALLVPIPLIQYAAGLLAFSGQAWISTAYLLGFFLSLTVGARWERNRFGQAMDALLFAIGMAALISVGLQLYQWLSLSGLDVWIMSTDEGRPFGNLIQPNQMATLLLWALIAVAWFVHKQKIGPLVAMLVAMYLVIGIALTQSRTAIVAMVLIAVAGWYWRALWYSRRNLWLGLFLLAFFAICSLAIRPLSEALLLDRPFDVVSRMAVPNVRLGAYSLFIDALLRRPLSGYGWTAVAPAQLAVAENHVNMQGIYQHSHNLFLDLMLWVGIPVGGLIVILIIVWFYRQVRRVKHIEEALLVLFTGVVGWHAMLELPLHYAYMLLPTGLVMGALGVRLNEPVVLRTGRVGLAICAAAAVTLLGFITRDYLRMEADFQALRFERTYKMRPPRKVPDTLVLSQLEAFIRLGRMSAKSGMRLAELSWMRDVTYVFPTRSNLFAYASALALNGFPEESRLMMMKMAKVMMPKDYEELGQLWADQGLQSDKLAAIRWPNATDH